MPSAVRDDDRRKPGTKPKSNRRSDERDRCPDGGKDVGECTASREPRCLLVQTRRDEEKKRKRLRHTGCRERIVVGTQAQEKEQRREPDTDPKEGCHVSKGGRFDHGPAAICLARQLTRLVRDMCEMEEPQKVVDDDEYARGDEGWGGEGDNWPRVGEILKVYNVAEYGKRDLVRGEGIGECQQDVY